MESVFVHVFRLSKKESGLAVGCYLHSQRCSTGLLCLPACWGWGLGAGRPDVSSDETQNTPHSCHRVLIELQYAD